MSTTRIPLPVYYLLLLIIIIFSFYNFAEINFPLLNSNMAVNALMAQSLNLPGDFYFWGQDRTGSLIPLLSNFLVEAYKFPPILAVSVIHYFILIAGFFAIASFFRNPKLKLIMALIWFFPCCDFLALVTTLFGIQMCMVVLALYFLRLMQKAFTFYLRIVWLSLACLSFVVAIWVSDLAILSFLIVVLVVIWKYWSLLKKNSILQLFKTRDFLLQSIIVFFWFIIGTVFILYAKHKAMRVEAYHINHMNHPGEIVASFKIIGYSIWRVLIFASDNFMESISAWTILAGIPILVSISYRKSQFLEFCSLNKLLVFFSLNAIFTFIFLMISHWVFLNGTTASYFSLVYISAWIAFLLFMDSSGSKDRQLRMILLLLIVLPGSISSCYQFFIPKMVPSKLTQLQNFTTLGDCGLISDYKTAYVVACVNPKHIIATPNDKDHVRNYYYAESVFKMPKFYLIRNGWLTSFPDTLMQFGHILSRKGTPFKIDEYNLCQYERVFYKRSFSGEEMQHQGKIVADPSARFGKSIVIDKDFNRKKHFIFGPFLSLKQGTILVQYSLKSEPDLNTKNMAVIEISAEYGKKILATQAIRSCDFQRRNTYQLFELKTTLDKDYNGVEFRIMYLGGPDLNFDRVDLTGM